MVKLSVELIQQAYQHINPVRDRELDLRGYKIPVIENLGATLVSDDGGNVQHFTACIIDNISSNVIYACMYCLLCIYIYGRVDS